ncbi:apolipoprotein N-acyltransferase [Limnofasciculus baicalensis]|uniref:Apolipoprotein N-acyltransferase n=1 Tax=Limnofasciculus baicalensis BBK-W-15 TaxID=2699891 RepID=A0AAE3KQ71_9CYAN|nr:apolipoprotein N-acyltransferase [Limnofasciculus baicalensis]MCP2731581.1 apolipoprotein N-acyltransferase [Limnofasciculus baicalensis BBK-W-15]
MKIPKLFWQSAPFLLAGFGGILMGLTPGPVEAWFLAWVALVPLWFLVARSKSIRHSILYGLIWGIGYHGLALSWITGIHPMDWMGVPWLASISIAVFCWTFITLCGAILVSLWAGLITLLNNWEFSIKKNGAKTQNPKLKTLFRILLGVGLWCGLEAIWSSGSLWWSSLSYTQSPHNLVILHLGKLSGPSMVTAAIVAVNGLMAEAWISYDYSQEMRRWDWESPQFGKNLSYILPPPFNKGGWGGENFGNKQVSFPKQDAPWEDGEKNNYSQLPKESITYFSIAIGLLFILHAIGFGLYSRPLNQPTETALKVGIIQGNISNRIKLYPEGWYRAIQGYTKGYNKLADEGVQAVLTPETALPFLWENQVRDRSPFYSAILDKGVLAWVGALGEEGGGFTNSLFTVTGAGETFSRYDKTKLVPLGEYIPFQEILAKLINRLSPLNADLVPGKPNQVFETPYGRAIVGICYESAFANHFRKQAANGGEFILTASNNAHYTQTMPAQHHALDVMRAIETDRWAVRATNTGYSGIVDPHGKTIWISGINIYEIHSDTIYRRQTQTLYVEWGDWLTPLLLVLAALTRGLILYG